MATTIQQAKIADFAALLPAASAGRIERYREAYDHNRHRLYALAFWMSDNELAAEELMRQTFRRAFARTDSPSAESLDRDLITELRASMILGVLTLNESASTEVLNVRRNTLRVHLERAVVEVPATERMIFLMHDVECYEHERIARTLGITEDESRLGLHQARLRVRNLVSLMQR